MSHACTAFDCKSASICALSNNTRRPIRVQGIEPSAVRRSKVGSDILSNPATVRRSSVSDGRRSSATAISSAIKRRRSSVIACPISCKGSALFAACSVLCMVAPFYEVLLSGGG